MRLNPHKLEILNPVILNFFYIFLVISLTFSLSEAQGQVFAFIGKKKRSEKATLSFYEQANRKAMSSLIISKAENDCKTFSRLNYEGETSSSKMVYVMDSVLVPETYVIDHDYFQVWDAWSVNPYSTSVHDFDDHVKLNLRDTSSRYDSFVYPLEGAHHVTSSYGTRHWKFHHGTDIRVKIGDPVRAVFDGVVRMAKYNRHGYGNYVVVRHANGLETLYGHLNERSVQVGDEVRAGQTIGKAGNTGRSSGPHLHFEVRYAGLDINPEQIFDWKEESTIPNEITVNAASFPEFKEHTKAKYHRIRNGDSLWVLARRYGCSINRICRMNGISRKTVLRVGRRLRVR